MNRITVAGNLSYGNTMDCVVHFQKELDNSTLAVWFWRGTYSRTKFSDVDFLK